MNIEKFVWEPKCYDGFRETVEKEIFEDKIKHSSEIENFDEIFGKNNILFYSTKKKKTQKESLEFVIKSILSGL